MIIEKVKIDFNSTYLTFYKKTKLVIELKDY